VSAAAATTSVVGCGTAAAVDEAADEAASEGGLLELLEKLLMVLLVLLPVISVVAVLGLLKLLGLLVLLLPLEATLLVWLTGALDESGEADCPCDDEDETTGEVTEDAAATDEEGEEVSVAVEVETPQKTTMQRWTTGQRWTRGCNGGGRW
jgi:hypothetical protein